MSNKTVVIYGGSLTHHGIPGMKWGVWNEDTKARYTGGKRKREKKSLTDEQKKKLDKLDATLAKLTVAAAVGIYVAKNPKLRAIAASAVKKVGRATALSRQKTVKGFKQGFREGVKEGPKKLGRTAAIGLYMVAGKKRLDNVLGKDLSDAAFKANDKKKIGNFWTGLDNKRKEDDDDDE